MSNTEKTIKQNVEFGTQFLKSFNIENPRLEAEILLGFILGLSRTRIILNNNEKVSGKDYEKFEDLLKKKSTGMPTGYILGYKEFFERDFEVNPSVLIPRPETEELVEWIMESHDTLTSLLDMCCGSGCIGITLALQIKVDLLFLSDKSEEALFMAKRNAERLLGKQNMELYQSDLFASLKIANLDLIVSNPPYVTSTEYARLDTCVKNFEPREALLIENPDAFNEKLIQGANSALAEGGAIYLETNPIFIDSLKKILENSDFSKVETKIDLSGKERFIRAFKRKA